MLSLSLSNKYYGDLRVFHQTKLTIYDQDWCMIIGESGCGKTTLLKILTGLTDYEGSIYYNNHLLSYKDMKNLRRNELSIVFQEKNLIEEYTVYENLLIAAKLSSCSIQEINDLLTHFHLEQLKKHKINQLSGGQQQKISIIRSILTKPQILFLDEPTGSLDKQSTHEIIEMLQEINKTTTIVMITHDLELTQFAHHVYEIKNEHIYQIKNNDTHYSHQKNNQLKRKKLPKSFLLKLSLWNFRYYFKTYIFIIVLLTLTLSGYIFSSQLGKHINKKTDTMLIEKNKNNELQIVSDNILNKENIKTLANTTHAIQYNLHLRLLKNYTINQIYIDNQKIYFQNINIKNTYDISKSTNKTVITSQLLKDIQKINKGFKTIDIPLMVLSTFDTSTVIYWTDKDYILYKPAYTSYKLHLSEYEVIDSQEYNIYLDNQTLETIADNCQQPSSISNQNITKFSLKYKNHNDLQQAKNEIEKQKSMSIHSIYTDLEKVQNEITQQFLIFRYTSTILVIISILIIIFMHLILYNNKKRQHQIFYELGLNSIERQCIQYYEISLCLIITILLSVLLSIFTMNMFNAKLILSDFLPHSFVEFYRNNHLQINQLKWFNVSLQQILQYSITLLIIPTLILYLGIYIYEKLMKIYSKKAR